MNVSASLNLLFNRLALFGSVTLLLALCSGGFASPAKAQRPSKPGGQTISPQSAARPAQPCCEITGIDASGVVTAQDKTTGKTFQFQVNDTNLLTSLHVGQSVSANFNAGRVSVANDPENPTTIGSSTGGCCAIVGAGGTSQSGITNTAGTSGPQSKPVPADDLPNIRMQIRELKHNANSVTLRFTLFNDGNAPFALGYNFGGWANVQNARLIDSATNKSYTVSILNGCQCSENVRDVAPKAQVDVWAKFSLPPEVQLVTITIPHFTPMDDVPIGFVGGPGLGPVDGAKPLGPPVGGKPLGSLGAVKGIKTPLTNLPGGSRPSGSGSSSSSGNTNTPSGSPACPQGAPAPGTQDNFAKSATTAAVCFIASCGASMTLNGNTFPAGSSDWVAFTVPDSRASCANPVITVSTSSSGGGSAFDVLASPAGGAVVDSYTGFPATGVQGIAGLGTANSPLQPGTYFIRIHGVAASTVGTWTLKIAS